MREIVGMALALVFLRVHGENLGDCADGKCFVLQTDGATFDEAQQVCEGKGGHLMTVRTKTAADVLAGLLNGSSGNFWLGLKYAGDRCSDSNDGLNGYKWVTGDITSHYFNWKSEPVVCPQLCASVSHEDHKWTERACDDRIDGYLCEFDNPGSCKPLSTYVPVTYKTPFGFTANELLGEIPQQTNATLQPLGTKHVCFDTTWLQAPWSCEVFAGGCDYMCVKNGQSNACVCQPGLQLDDNGVTCSRSDVDPCARAECEHQCARDGDAYTCMCRSGFTLAADGKSCKCNPGFSNENGICVDVDECEYAPCEHDCVNTDGGYQCQCFEGYRQSMEDVHKCDRYCAEVRCPSECDPNNSAQCNCPDGFVLDDDQFCVDIDECESNYCDQKCENHPGGYECSCFDGFVLMANGKCEREDSEGSGSSTPFDDFVPTSRSPTDQPMSTSAGSLLGIMICIVFCIVFLVCLAHCIMRRLDKMHHYDMHKGQDELCDFQQVIIDKNSTQQTIPNSALRMGYTFILILFGLCINNEVVKSTTLCSINGYAAFCINRGLHQVPELPTHVNYVDLSLNSLAELNETSFSRLERLQVVILTHQTPGLVIRSNTFIRLANLTSLQLDYNHLLQLESGAFNGLSNLKNLTLTQCGLDDSILSGDFLKPLESLEMLVLNENNIQRIQPASFFVNMRRLHVLNLSRNKVKSICEEDLLNFQGKHFDRLELSYVTLQDMNEYWSGWEKCGKPFKKMSITLLDLSGNGFKVPMAQRFFDAISGTKIQSLILRNSYSMGSSFGHNNFKDPDKFTFKGLEASGVKAFDVSKSRIFALSNAVFSHFPDLEEMTLAQNEINIIENNGFWGMTNLLKLNLSNNYLGNIDAKTFQNLDKLEVLDLSLNHIRVLGDKTFQGLPSLLNLNLIGNALESVYKFATLPKLEKLYLGDNRISSLYGLPNAAKNLTTIDLEFNRLKDLSDLYTILREFPQIEKIFLQGNMFSNCNNQRQVVVSDRLQLLHLGLSTMQLIWSVGKCLNVFDNLQQLEQLSLTANGLQSLPKDIFKDLTSLFFLDLSFNSLKYIPNGIFPKSLQILNLEYNSIYSVDPNLFSTLSYLSLLKNDFRCDCNLRDFQTWLNQTSLTLVHPVEDVTCASPEDQYMVSVVRSSIQCEDEEDEASIENLRLMLFIFCTTLIILLTTSAIIYIRRRGYIFKLYKKLTGELLDRKREEPDPDRFLYDVYVCYSSSDFKWVERVLLKRLDSQFSEHNTLHCCFEERDFIPGEDHLTNMRSAIQSSRKTLCVVSERFLKDGWCLETFTLAQCRMLVELKDILLVLVVGNIPQYRLLKHEQLRSYIENRRYLLWPEDTQDLEWFYDQLLNKIRKHTKVKQTSAKEKGQVVENNPEAAIILKTLQCNYEGL